MLVMTESATAHYGYTGMASGAPMPPVMVTGAPVPMADAHGGAKGNGFNCDDNFGNLNVIGPIYRM
jgi:hypothetical protein